MEANENTIKLYYNTEVEKLAMPEYGRNVLKMVEIMKEIPDRVVLRPDGSAAVIDYKFVQPEKKYLDQVRGYMDLYRALGHSPVTGTLWYIREDGEDEFVEV